MDYVVKTAEKHGCKKELIDNFIYRKYGHLNYLSNRIGDDDKKNQIRTWLKKYDFTDYLKELDKPQISEIASLI